MVRLGEAEERGRIVPANAFRGVLVREEDHHSPAEDGHPYSRHMRRPGHLGHSPHLCSVVKTFGLGS